MLFGIPDRRLGHASWRGWLVAVFGACLLLPVRASAQQPVLDSIPRYSGTLRPGDQLRVDVYRDKELSGNFLIDSHGILHIPGLGPVRVAGLDPAQLQERIKLVLIERGFEKADVAVRSLIRVSVLGEVAKPALYVVEPGTNLIQLLTSAGGALERSKLEETQVVRDGKVYTVDMQSALGGSAAGRIVLYSNDIVFVPRRRRPTTQMLSVFAITVSMVATLASLYLQVKN